MTGFTKTIETLAHFATLAVIVAGVYTKDMLLVGAGIAFAICDLRRSLEEPEA